MFVGFYVVLQIKLPGIHITFAQNVFFYNSDNIDTKKLSM